MPKLSNSDKQARLSLSLTFELVAPWHTMEANSSRPPSMVSRCTALLPSNVLSPPGLTLRSVERFAKTKVYPSTSSSDLIFFQLVNFVLMGIPFVILFMILSTLEFRELHVHLLLILRTFTENLDEYQYLDFSHSRVLMLESVRINCML